MVKDDALERKQKYRYCIRVNLTRASIKMTQRYVDSSSHLSLQMAIFSQFLYNRPMDMVIYGMPSSNQANFAPFGIDHILIRFVQQ